MLFTLAAILTATVVVTAEPTTAAAAVHAAVAGNVILTDARGEKFEAPGVELVLACAKAHEEPRTATSDRHGAFRFTDVGAGRCSLTADLQGFGTAITEVAVPAAETVQVEIHLEVAPVDSGVRVVGKSTRSWPTRRFN